jgi:hypothetical protein
MRVKQKKSATPTVESGQVWQSKSGRDGFAWVTWVGVGPSATVCWRSHDTTAAPLESTGLTDFLARFELTTGGSLVVR